MNSGLCALAYWQFNVDIHFLGSPQRQINSPVGSLNRDIASFYVTPNITLKAFPNSRIVPPVCHRRRLRRL